MDELTRKIEAARPQLRVEWSPERERAALRGVRALDRRRTRVRQGAAVVAAAAIAAIALIVLREPRASLLAWTAPPSFAPTASALVVPGDDTTEITRTGERSYTLARGSARVAAVAHAPVDVRAGDVRVITSDGDFVIERQGQGAHIRVTAGHLRVLWGVGEADLSAGDSGTFPPDTAPPSSASAAPTTTSAPPKPSASSPSPDRAPGPSWRDLARDGDFDNAYAAVQSGGPTAVHDEPGDLLLAADVARMSRHPAKAVDFLRALLQSHRGDPRASLAAFTLGRVLLDELGRPREAADAFAQARSLAPGGALAEDALAREVEAASRAGDTSRARARAEEYVRRYPNGMRSKSVRKYGGLE